jgi:uncharacterized protein YqjF (DUF2071 family)
MVSFAVDPGLLRRYVPAGTILDTHAGNTYASLVAFQFLDTRLLGWRLPFHRSFDELNLRFYVRRDVGGETRRAVVFIREVVPRRAIALAARALYNEPYTTLPMRHAISGDPPRVEYSWRLGGIWHGLGAEAVGAGTVPPLESHEAFITEHYWGYTRRRDGGTLEYRVEHPRWTVRPARLSSLPELVPLYGTELSGALRNPASVLIADGSPVTVHRGVTII